MMRPTRGARIDPDLAATREAWRRAVNPRGLPSNAGPMMVRCDAAGPCTTNQASLVGFVCEMHRAR
ncbi:MAG: hypothetical protein M5U28_13490 [Sandaracinaceae bacterium]|nr:hypothetical protein [Sandaracinaceae bacterium]